MIETNDKKGIGSDAIGHDLPTENPTDVLVHQEPKLVAMVDPNAVMQFGHKLKWYIQKNKLSVNIQGKEYAMVDGWKFAGMNFGIVPMCDKPIRMHSHKEALYIHKRNQKDRYGKQVQTISLLTTNKEMHDEHKHEADAIFSKRNNRSNVLLNPHRAQGHHSRCHSCSSCHIASHRLDRSRWF